MEARTISLWAAVSCAYGFGAPPGSDGTSLSAATAARTASTESPIRSSSRWQMMWSAMMAAPGWNSTSMGGIAMDVGGAAMVVTLVGVVVWVGTVAPISVVSLLG